MPTAPPTTTRCLTTVGGERPTASLLLIASTLIVPLLISLSPLAPLLPPRALNSHLAHRPGPLAAHWRDPGTDGWSTALMTAEAVRIEAIGGAYCPPRGAADDTPPVALNYRLRPRSSIGPLSVICAVPQSRP